MSLHVTQGAFGHSCALGHFLRPQAAFRGEAPNAFDGQIGKHAAQSHNYAVSAIMIFGPGKKRGARGRKTIPSRDFAESDTLASMKQTEEDAERMREAFRLAMKETGLKLETWCNNAGIAGNGPRAFLKGKTNGLHTSTVLALARAIGWPASRLMAQSAMTLPIVGNMLTGGEIIIADAAMRTKLGEVDAPPGADFLTKAISVRGRENYPEFDDGDVILYRDDWQPVESMIGKRSVIKLADGRLLVGRILNGEATGHHMVQRINAPPIINAQIAGVTPIRWVIPAV